MKDFILQIGEMGVRSCMSFEQLVKGSFSQLSSGQKKVATFLLDNLEKVVFYTAVQIGREAEVSETTVIRFAYALGFKGFSEMQAAIQQYVLENSTSRFIEDSPHQDEESNIFARVLERDIANLRQTHHQLNYQDVWKAVDWLMQADQVLIVGYRASYAAAHWFHFMLSMIRQHVSIIPLSSEIEERIISLTEKSVVVVISFPRYSKETIQITEACKRMGARIVAATDRTLSPVSRLSDISFITDINNVSGHYSNASVINLLNLLMAGIEEKYSDQTKDRIQKVEVLYSQWEVFEE